MSSSACLLCLAILFTILPTQTNSTKPNSENSHKKPNKKVLPPHLQEVSQDSLRWEPNYAPRLNQLMQRKSFIIDRMRTLSNKVSFDFNMPADVRRLHMRTFEVFSRQLNATERLVVQALQWLENSLKADFKSGFKVVEGSEKRLESLRDAVLQEEMDHSALIKAGDALEKFNQSHVEGMIDGILQDVAMAADQLEENLEEHIFDNAALRMGRGSNVEAVIRLEGGPVANRGDSPQPQESVIKLVDAEDNQFVLTKGKDSTVPHEDHQLIQDLMVVVVVATLCGWLASSLSLPAMFGYIVGGIILGPSGLNLLKSVVQVETLADFGVFFILLAVGLEFSPGTIRKVVRVAVCGAGLMSGCMILGGLVVGALCSTPPRESVFVAACLSLSSTPLVVKFLTSASEKDSLSHTDYGVALLGILVMQDVLLGLIVALLPSVSRAASYTVIDVILVILTLVASMAVVACVVYLLGRHLLAPVYRYLRQRGSKELTLLVTVCLAFSMLHFTHSLHLSMELGSFLAGIVISAQGHGLGEDIEGLLQPIRDFFATIFFASIGLHVFPQFLAYEMTMLTTLTMLTVGSKYVISVLVLALLVPRSSSHLKWIVSAGLAQVSEFSFVLGSRARRLGIISREVYLLILAVTTLSLLFAPVLWRLTIWQMQLTPPTRRNSALPVSSTKQTHPETSP